MELGITIPLQRLLRIPQPPYGEREEKSDCWDLHCITLRGRDSLLAVHCTTRYTFVRYDLTGGQWADLEGTFQLGLADTCAAIGAAAPLCQGARVTKTHGRREVAYLNRAWDDVVALDYSLDEGTQHQPLLDYAVNTKICACAGYVGKGAALTRFLSLCGEKMP